MNDVEFKAVIEANRLASEAWAWNLTDEELHSLFWSQPLPLPESEPTFWQKAEILAGPSTVYGVEARGSEMSAAALLANDALRASRDQMTMANAAASHKHAATSVTLSINSLSSNLLCVVEFRPNGGDWCQAESWSTEREANEACAIHRRYQGGPVSWRVRKR